MQLPGPLIRGRLIKRYKRFLADVELDDGEVVTVHCANPGSMTGLQDPGIDVWLSYHDKANRKLPYSWELARVDGVFVGINTANPNRIVEEAITTGRIPELGGYDKVYREVRYGQNSRIDFLLEDEAKGDCYVEVKNVHLKRRESLAEFPDAITKRGLKHLHELIQIVQNGKRAVMLYLVQRQDCEIFSIAKDIDPDYKNGLDEALAAGVEALCYGCHITVDEISVAYQLAIMNNQNQRYDEL